MGRQPSCEPSRPRRRSQRGGKSHLRRVRPHRRVPPGAPFVNADVIAAERWPEDPVSHAHDVAQAAEVACDVVLARGESFITETVASHESKIDLVRRACDAGYYVHLIVVAVPEEYSVERVRMRVCCRWPRRSRGEDPVTVAATAGRRRRDDRTGRQRRGVRQLRARALPIIATFVAGEIVGAPRWPDWTPEALAARWPIPNDQH